MLTQSDSKTRVVSLSNLRAMCDRVSGVCHRYDVIKVSRSRAHIQYSNPDEYGSGRPIVAVCAVIPGHGSEDRRVVNGAEVNPRIILDPITYLTGNDPEIYDPYQSFIPILDCPSLWRSGPYAADWHTHSEVRPDDDRCTCTIHG